MICRKIADKHAEEHETAHDRRHADHIPLTGSGLGFRLAGGESEKHMTQRILVGCNGFVSIPGLNGIENTGVGVGQPGHHDRQKHHPADGRPIGEKIVQNGYQFYGLENSGRSQQAEQP